LQAGLGSALTSLSLDRRLIAPAPEQAGEVADEAVGLLSLDERPQEQPPAVIAVNQILSHAIQEEASDTHVESHRAGVIVRYRVDGVMFDRCAMRLDLAPAVLSRPSSNPEERNRLTPLCESSVRDEC
jgi:type II secretory ATPase GspE/PulE/Tfp pilus assembly ATPase PilB-like protein